MVPTNGRSIPDLLSDAVSQLAKLVGNEFALARAEISEKAQQMGRAVAFIGAGAVLMIPALVIALLAVAAALKQSGFSDTASYFMTAVGAVLVSGGLIWVGFNRLSGDALKPGVTLDQIERDKSAVKEMVR